MKNNKYTLKGQTMNKILLICAVLMLGGCGKSHMTKEEFSNYSKNTKIPFQRRDFESEDFMINGELKRYDLYCHDIFSGICKWVIR